MIIHELYSMSPTVNFVTRSKGDTGAAWGPRLIPDCQLFYVISGEALLELGPNRYRVLPGECVFYGANSPHRLSAVKLTDYISLHFSWNGTSLLPVHPAHGIRAATPSELALNPASYGLVLPEGKVLTLPHHACIPGIETTLLEMVVEYQYQQLAHPYLLRSLLMKMIALLVRQLRSPSHSQHGLKIQNALRAMRDHPAKNWSVSELAQLCGYHSSYFTRLFHDEVGQNPKSYLISERIRQAKQALLNGERIDCIAERLGYMSIHYFSRNFKKETGVTPSEFKQQGIVNYPQMEVTGLNPN
ncbi:helix-turn-helix transcriptional regulator [Paenibacillus sp. UNC451MF]|uniref:helix-turn-helix transcriptional regulator n=1 Tax=Paenibacillus sp. UNC451MF TaxID=1449063 RepID=UPI00068F8162|nr:AraC family transcriptional regulator [Paenibacillus sp. UNC451MF]